MGFIFGIINLDDRSVNGDDISTFCTAVKWEGFEDHIEIAETYALGYCWNPDRQQKSGILQYENLTILWDARFYNNDRLKNGFDYNSDGEAFAKAYLRWGVSCADKFNGDFSIVIIDSTLQKILLFRDHIGARPLCWAIQNNQLIFSSHEFGIARSKLIDNTISEETLIRDFFRHKKKKYEQTVFKNIQRVIPGHCLSVSSDKIEPIKYWFPEKIKKDNGMTFHDAALRLKHLLIESSARRLEYGKVGVHVSGGIDSSGVAAIISDIIDDKNRMTGYSWSPEESMDVPEGINEKMLVEDLAAQKNITIKYFSWDDQSLIEDFILPEFENVRNELQTMKQAKADGVKTVFSGWGGDEFVSLSLRGAMNHILFCLKLPAFIRWVKHFGIKATLSKALWETLPLFIPFGLLDRSSTKRSGYKFFKKLFILKNWKLFFFNRKKNIYGFGDRNGLMINFLENYHLPHRMDTWAIFGEKFGVEYKYPLLDKDLLEFWFSIPLKHTYETMLHRHLYREALNGILPERTRMRLDKREPLLRKHNLQHKLKIKRELASRGDLFSEDGCLPFFQIGEFQKLIASHTNEQKQIGHQLFDIQFYLKYKFLCEKYL
jgi:asparagine synthase (glutamine-hydrolysing)